MRLALALTVAGALALAQSSAAAPVVEGTFDLPATAKRLALGPDGNMWVQHAATAAGEEVSRVTPGGVVDSFNFTPNDSGGVVGGPDGAVWMTHTGGVVRIVPGDPPAATQHNITNLTNPEGITLGLDGNLWAPSGTNVIKIVPTVPPTSQSFPEIAGPATTANGISPGTDGRIWVADQTGKKIVSLTTDGTATDHPIPEAGGAADGAPQDVAAGPGGQVLYSNPTAATLPQHVARLVQGGTPERTDLPGTDPFGIVFANDGAYWIAQFNGKNLGRLMPDGSYTTFGDFSSGSHFPRNVAKGAGNDLWVILDNPGNPSKIARISGVEPPAVPGTPGTPSTPIAISDTAVPSVSRISMARAFSVGRARTPVSLNAAVGTRIRFTLSEAAAVRLSFQRVLPGRRRGRRCVPPRRARRGARRCSRYRRVGAALRRNGAAGRNSVRFTGRIGRRALRVGPHRVRIDATDAAGNKSPTRTRRFRIVPRRKRR